MANIFHSQRAPHGVSQSCEGSISGSDSPFETDSQDSLLVDFDVRTVVGHGVNSEDLASLLLGQVLEFLDPSIEVVVPPTAINCSDSGMVLS